MLIEGTDGNDSLQGTTGDDRLIGGFDDDTLVGGGGEDIAVFAGSSSEYEVTLSEGITIVENTCDLDEGTDILVGIETIQFTNQNIAI